MKQLRSPQEWSRVGGSELQFFATDDELVDILDHAVPAEYAPYRGIGRAARKVPNTRTYEWSVFECALSEAVGCVRRLAVPFFWLATADTPTGEATLDDEAARSFTGLIQIEPIVMRRGGGMGSGRIAYIPRARNLLTRSTEENEDYMRIWDSLRKAIKSRLTWTTIRVFPDGVARENDRHELMTDLAAEAARGAPGEWSVQPGRRLPEPSKRPRDRGHVTR